MLSIVHWPASAVGERARRGEERRKRSKDERDFLYLSLFFLNLLILWLLVFVINWRTLRRNLTWDGHLRRWRRQPPSLVLKWRRRRNYLQKGERCLVSGCSQVTWRRVRPIETIGCRGNLGQTEISVFVFAQLLALPATRPVRFALGKKTRFQCSPVQESRTVHIRDSSDTFDSCGFNHVNQWSLEIIVS